MSLSGMHIAFYKACSSSSTAGCCWTQSHGSVKPGTTSVLSDGPPRKRKREKRSVWRDGRGRTDWLTGEGRGLKSLQSLQRQSHWSLEVPAEASVSVQSSHSKIWTEGPGQWWQCGAPFKCFTNWCTYNIFMSFNSEWGSVFCNASIFKQRGFIREGVNCERELN